MLCFLFGKVPKEMLSQLNEYIHHFWPFHFRKNETIVRANSLASAYYA